MHDLCLETMRLMTLACFSLLLLLLFLFKISPAADGSAKFQSFKTGSVPKLTPIQAKGDSRNNKGEDGSESVLGDEKRKINTGPNPLHNSGISRKTVCIAYENRN